jgi:hypothetical protein
VARTTVLPGAKEKFPDANEINRGLFMDVWAFITNIVSLPQIVMSSKHATFLAELLV